jgi:cyanate lyase
MNRADVTAMVLEAKRQSGLTWKQIAEALGTGSPVFYTAALLGHQALTPEEAQKAAAVLKLDGGASRAAPVSGGGSAQED